MRMTVLDYDRLVLPRRAVLCRFAMLARQGAEIEQGRSESGPRNDSEPHHDLSRDREKPHGHSSYRSGRLPFAASRRSRTRCPLRSLRQ